MVHFKVHSKYFYSKLDNSGKKVYEKILGEKLLAPAFRRTISDKLEDTGKMTGNAGHRPSRLFRYKR